MTNQAAICPARTNRAGTIEQHEAEGLRRIAAEVPGYDYRDERRALVERARMLRRLSF